MKSRFLYLIFILSFISVNLLSQNPVSWSFKLSDKGNGEIEIVANASIEPGWHLYDTEIESGGPFPTSLVIDEIKGAEAVGKFHAVNSKLHKEFDKIFEMEVGYYDTSATFVQRIKVNDKAAFLLKGYIRAQACDDRECTPPIPVDFEFTAANLPAGFNVPANQPKDSKPEEKIPLTDTVSEESVISESDSTALSITTPAVSSNDLWRPVIDELRAFGAEGNRSNQTLWIIFISGLIGGFLALLTPCVWPMIPMTVSFFLKRNKKSRSKAVGEAVMYGVGIIVIYVSLGLFVTAVFGASALNEMATSAFFNLIFFGLLVFFAASFLGAFELTLPASWTTKMDSKADSTTGFISIFFMAFTLALVSFSCTGPLIGWLLVQAASSGAILAPAIGMFGFALGLAMPFALFAVFPSWLQEMPKSGGWLNSVKVVLGFLELALALKFLSVADLAYKWGILDREVFLVLWIVIFILLGVYLLGKLKFAHDSDLPYISVTRLFLAIIPLSFAMYLIPGLWGAPLKAISAFVPPLYTQDFNLFDGTVHAKFDDFESGMEHARKNNKPVIIDFSGYGCVNCRKMEASVWTDPRVKSMLENDFVLITLMVDDRDKLPEVIEVEENGKLVKLRTVGDKWSYLQRHKFGTNSQPYYVLLDANGMPIGPSFAFDENVSRYIDFLQTGLNNFRRANRNNP